MVTRKARIDGPIKKEFEFGVLGTGLIVPPEVFLKALR